MMHMLFIVYMISVWSYSMKILVKIGWIVKPYGLPPLNINTKASVSMQYILKQLKSLLQNIFFLTFMILWLPSVLELKVCSCSPAYWIDHVILDLSNRQGAPPSIPIPKLISIWITVTATQSQKWYARPISKKCVHWSMIWEVFNSQWLGMWLYVNFMNK